MTEQSTISLAPWTPEQVKALNAYQKNPDCATYRCDKIGCFAPSVATERGWRCPDCRTYSTEASALHTTYSDQDALYALREGD